MLPVVGASSRFLIVILILTVDERVADVNLLPDLSGEMIASIFRSLLLMEPVHVPVFGWRVMAAERQPGLPLILARTATQYAESFDKPLIVQDVASVTATDTISSPRSIITS